MTNSIKKQTAFSLALILVFTMIFSFMISPPANANADPGDEFYINSISIDDTKGYPSKAGDDANLIIELCNISDEIISSIYPYVIPPTTPLVFSQIPDISGTSDPNSEITETITAIYTVTQEDVDRGFFEFDIIFYASTDPNAKNVETDTWNYKDYVYASSYNFIGEKVIITDNTKPQSFSIDGDYWAHFFGGEDFEVDIDGVPVNASDLTHASGSIIITLLPSIIQKLSNGSHTLNVVMRAGTIFPQGTASTVFDVNVARAAGSNGAANASTGDSTNPWIFISIAVLAILAMSTTLIVWRKRVLSRATEK